MNNHGQSLVLFIIIIPLVLLLLAVIVDLGLITTQKVKLNEVTREILKEVITKENYEDLIKRLYQENNIATSKLEIKKDDSIESIFGKIIGLKSYPIKVDLKAYYVDNKLKIE